MKIVYEDKDLWVIYKPAGLATQSSKSYEKDAVSLLKKACGGGYVGILHRLDQPVEGLLVFAKNKECAAKLSAQLKDKELNKSYIAVVKGAALPEQHLTGFLKKEGNIAVYAERISPKSDTVDRGLIDNASRDVKKNASMKGSGTKDVESEWKRASLSYCCIAQNAELQISKLKVHLETGRFHQIRAQMAGNGYPLLGDLKYGDEASKRLSGELGVRFVALCADEIAFLHPKTGKEMHFQIEPEGSIFSTFEVI